MAHTIYTTTLYMVLILIGIQSLYYAIFRIKHPQAYAAYHAIIQDRRNHTIPHDTEDLIRYASRYPHCIIIRHTHIRPVAMGHEAVYTITVYPPYITTMIRTYTYWTDTDP